MMGFGLHVGTLAQNQPTITTEQILTSSTCSGQFLAVTYSTTGSFNWGNQFKAELSNNLGLFNNPVVIGWVPFNTGLIPCQIPLNTGLGVYRIRVVSTNPAVVGTPAQQPLLITNIPQATQIFIWPDDTVCYGDSIRLSVAPVFSNVQWSTGETGYQIYVSAPGTYSVKTYDVAGCEGRDTVKVGFKNCPLSKTSESADFEEFNFEVFPNPCNEEAWIKTRVSGPAHLVLSDVSGRIIITKHFWGENQVLDLRMIPAGYYYVTMISGKSFKSLSKPLLVLR